MRPFRYALDPLCLLSCLAYAGNRWLLKPVSHSAFLQGNFNDLLLIPAALPFLLWLERRLGLRAHDRPPSAWEVGAHWLIWSIMAEVIAPHLFTGAVGDIRDVIAYAAGALIAGCWWNRHAFVRNRAV